MPWRESPPWGAASGDSRSPTAPAQPRSHPPINCVTIRFVAKPKLTPGDAIPELVESWLVRREGYSCCQGLRGTPSRVSRALRELTDGYDLSAADIVAGAVFD